MPKVHNNHPTHAAQGTKAPSAPAFKPSPADVTAAKSMIGDWTNDDGGALILDINGFKPIDLSTLPANVSSAVAKSIKQAQGSAGPGSSGVAYLVPSEAGGSKNFIVVDAVNQGGGISTKSYHEEFRVLDLATGGTIAAGFFKNGMQDAGWDK